MTLKTTRRHILLPALCLALGALDASAQSASRWSGAVVKALPKIVAGPAAGPAARLDAFHAANDLSRYEHVVMPLVALMRRQAPDLTPERLMESPQLLALALQARGERAEEIVANHEKGAASPAAHVADSRDGDTLVMDSYPYLEPETLKKLGAIVPQLRKKAALALENAGLLAQKLADESRRTSDEAVAAIEPAAAPFQVDDSKAQQLGRAVIALRGLLANDSALDAELRELLQAQDPARRRKLGGALLEKARALFKAHQDAVMKDPALDWKGKEAALLRTAEVHQRLERLRRDF